MSKITALIPFLNGSREDWLAETLASLPHGMPYIVMRNDGELADAFNQGLAQVNTEFVFVIGADDLVTPKCLDYLGSLIWDADVTYPAMILTDEELEPIGYHPAYPFDGHRLLQWNYVPGCFLARTSWLRRVGGWRQLDALEDWDIHVRMFRAGARFKPVPEAEMIYRQSPGSRNKVDGGFDPDFWRSKIVGPALPVKATWYYQATPVTTYWRCQLPARHLPGRCLPDHAVHLSDDDAMMPEHEGTAIFQFPGDKERAFIATVAMPSLGIPVLAEVDDNYLVSMPHRTWKGWDKNIGDGHHTLGGHRYIVENIDGVICATEQLAIAYRKVAKRVFVCPNSIEPTDWPTIEKPDDGIFRIGWYASYSHADDTKLITRAMEWASRQKDVEVFTMGFHPSWKFPHRRIPWSNDVSVYWKAMEILDIGLCPVIANPWSICRSDLKAMEYSMGGACPLVSDQPPYAGWTDEEDCLKAGSGKEFFHKLKWLVGNREEAKALAAEAKSRVLGQRTMAHQIHKWEQAIAWE